MLYMVSSHILWPLLGVFKKSVKSSSIPKEECIKQHYMLVCDISAHIPCVKKHKFSPHIQNWKLRDPATASLFQLTFIE